MTSKTHAQIGHATLLIEQGDSRHCVLTKPYLRERTTCIRRTANRANMEAPLSHREDEILELLGSGATNENIASQLGVSVNTIKWHLKNIFLKLGAANRTSAVLAARQRGYFS